MSEYKQKATLSEREFCEAVGISRVTAWRLREAGQLAYCRVGSRIKYLPRHVEEFLESCEQRPHQSRRGKRVSDGGMA